MARQKGPLKVKGKIGDLSFYKSQDGYLLREKGGVSKHRIMNDPNFQRTRENGAEFGRAGMSGKLFRRTFAPAVGKSKDRLMASRLHRLMVRIERTDVINKRGHRSVANGDLRLLEDFEFNAKSGFGKQLYENTVVTVDRVTGACSVEIPEFAPATQLMAPESATHFQFTIAAAVIDFENGSSTVEELDSAMLPYGVATNPEVLLNVNLPAESTLPLFVMMKVAYFMESGTEKYPLFNGSYSAATVVLVDTI